MTSYFNSQVELFAKARTESPLISLSGFTTENLRAISWTDGLRTRLERQRPLNIADGEFVEATYRPFMRQWLYYGASLNERRYQMPAIFPEGLSVFNKVIALSATGGRAGLSVLMLDNVPSLHVAAMDGSQCFPLTLFEREDTDADDDLFSVVKDAKPTYRTRHGITDAGLAHFQAPRSSDYILNRPDGSPWFTAKDDKHLSKCWHAHMEAAGFYPGGFDKLTKEEKRRQLHFHDIRGTAVTMLSEAGATVPQIVSITGHTLQSATRILERYMAFTPALSKAAMTAFENAPETGFANRLQTRLP